MQKQVNMVSTADIVPNVYQPRKFFDENAIEELAQSIRTHGIIQPLTVRVMGENKYELVAGERRLRAARLIGMAEVPVIVVDITDSDSAAIALLENLQREDLNFLEESEAYYNLIKEHNYTQEQLADIIGKKQSTIANKIRLLKLDVEVRSMLLQHGLTERHARALLKLPTDVMQKSVLKQVIKRGLNVKKTEELIEKELLKLCNSEVASDSKKRIKGIFSPKIYINTVKQVFDKYGIPAVYSSKDMEDSLQITITIPKNQ